MLRSIHSEFLIHDDCSAKLKLILKLDRLEVIIKWLQVSVSDAIDKPFRLKIRFMSRDLVLSDRAICTIASRMNSFDTKLSDGGVCPCVLYHFL